MLGTTRGSVKEVGNRLGTVEAGLVTRLKSDATITTVSTDGLPLGISLGKDLSNIGRTAICYKGIGVPIQLASGFSPTLGAVVYVDNATGKAKASATDTTAVNAVFSGLLSAGAMAENGSSTVLAALVDFPGGL